MDIVISGASKGIGRAIAEEFAKDGHRLFLCARNYDVLGQTAHELRTKFPAAEILVMAVDLSLKNEVNNFVSWCTQNGSPEILVNNAGAFMPGNISDEPDGNLESMMLTNLYSAYYLTRGILPMMKMNKRGHIFNICSVAALKAYEDGGSYSISKFALDGFSKNLRYELRTSGIKVTTVFPGAVLTESWRDFDNSGKRIMESKDIAQMINAATKLSVQAVVEDIIIRPQLGDL